MSVVTEFSRTMTVTEATGRGVAGLLKDAEQGQAALVTRHGKPVAAVVGMARLQELRALESELRDALVVLTRIAGDTGTRIGLDEALSALGFDRASLEAELDEDLTAGRN